MLAKIHILGDCFCQIRKNEGNVINAPLTKTSLFFGYLSSIHNSLEIVNNFLKKFDGGFDNLVIFEKLVIFYQPVVREIL